VVALLLIFAGVLIATHGFRQEPPSDWLASYTSSTDGNALFYIHWANNNGNLQGTLEETAVFAMTGTTPVTVTLSIDGTYDYQSHNVSLNLHDNQGLETLSGTVENNDQLMLHSADSSSSVTGTGSSSDLVFHSSSSTEYENAKEHLSTYHASNT
jgi:hypothetical protein